MASFSARASYCWKGADSSSCIKEQSKLPELSVEASLWQRQHRGKGCSYLKSSKVENLPHVHQAGKILEYILATPEEQFSVRFSAVWDDRHSDCSVSVSTEAQHGLCGGPGQGAHGSRAQERCQRAGEAPGPGCTRGRECPARHGPAEPPQHRPEQPGHRRPHRAHILTSHPQKPCVGPPGITELKSHSWGIPWLLTENNNSI